MNYGRLIKMMLAFSPLELFTAFLLVVFSREAGVTRELSILVSTLGLGVIFTPIYLFLWFDKGIKE